MKIFFKRNTYFALGRLLYFSMIKKNVQEGSESVVNWPLGSGFVNSRLWIRKFGIQKIQNIYGFATLS